VCRLCGLYGLLGSRQHVAHDWDAGGRVFGVSLFAFVFLCVFEISRYIVIRQY